MWTRAANTSARSSSPTWCAFQLVDSVRVTTVLPYHLWEIAERLARAVTLRAEHQAILRDVDANDPAVAAVLTTQRQPQKSQTRTSSGESGNSRRSPAWLVGGRGRGGGSKPSGELATLDNPRWDLLADVGQGAGDTRASEQLSLDVQAVIDQADEAVRQVDEAGRGLLVLPSPRQRFAQSRTRVCTYVSKELYTRRFADARAAVPIGGYPGHRSGCGGAACPAVRPGASVAG